MAEGARMGVEPQFSGWEIGSPPRASFLIPPPGAWVRVRQQRGEGEEEEAVAAAAPFPWRTRARARRDGGKLVRIRGGSTLV